MVEYCCIGDASYRAEINYHESAIFFGNFQTIYIIDDNSYFTMFYDFFPDM